MPNVRLNLVHPSPIGDIPILSVRSGLGESGRHPDPGHAPAASPDELHERPTLQHIANGRSREIDTKAHLQSSPNVETDSCRQLHQSGSWELRAA